MNGATIRFGQTDTNRDGVIDSNDLNDKMASLENGLTLWMQNCGYRKKGGTKR